MATELELKLMVQSEYLKSASEFLDEFCLLSQTKTATRQATQSLMNGYFDTEEATLMQAGIALRIRAVNQQFIQTVKTRGSNRVGMHARGEWEWSIPSDQLNLSLLNEVPLPDSLADMAWSRHLLEVFRTDFERQIWLIEEHGTAMEVVCDCGKVTSPFGEDKISELELELKSGDESGLYRFALQLAKQLPVQVSTVSKAQKGVRLKQGTIEFPEKPNVGASKLALAAYWYEVWLVYWEAMLFMKDDILIQPVRHSMAQLARCLPQELASRLDRLDEIYQTILQTEDAKLLSAFASNKETGIIMLEIAQWLNRTSYGASQ
ncbi:CYTH domain-containing protein [Marinomonas pollencensis]|uniref:CYTH domain-containing protein n=1 Tax=Marinomonas pollencensis TaxID=491954 RepID=A0A3E0DM54_9GAMM|nr:CYTH domain-containing protein [Marinomonas pollencensis]REG82860.1 CYTH domain-containing protein [Marinomonas pollencensis]